MSEVIVDNGELMAAGHRVGDHLLAQIDSGNPILSESRDRFVTAAIVAEFTGEERAFELALAEVVEFPEGLNLFYVDSFADALIAECGEQGAAEARELAHRIPNHDNSDNAIMRASILTRVAEATGDLDLKTKSVNEAESLLIAVLKQQPLTYSLSGYPSDFLLRLGITSQRKDLIDIAADKLPPDAFKYEFMEIIAKGLNIESASDIRPSLVDAAVKAEEKGIGYPGPIVRYGFKDLIRKRGFAKIAQGYPSGR